MQPIYGKFGDGLLFALPNYHFICIIMHHKTPILLELIINQLS